MKWKRKIAWPLLRFFPLIERWYYTAIAILREEADDRYKHNTIGNNVYLDPRVILKGYSHIGNRSVLVKNVSIEEYTTVGEDCILFGEVNIGRYCQFGPKSAVYALNHAITYLTPYNNNLLFNGRLKEVGSSNPVNVGHGVWIGHSAIVLPGVNVGDGAIIGAGSVVTADVEPYHIVVGNPARAVRTRFDMSVIELLDQWRWWELRPEQLMPYEELFRMDLQGQPEMFVSRLREILQRL